MINNNNILLFVIIFYFLLIKLKYKFLNIQIFMGNFCKKLCSKKTIENELNKIDDKTVSLFINPTFVNENFTINDFTKINFIGEGSFGKVLLVKLNKTNEYFAMKILDKKHLIKLNQVNNTKNERNIFKSVKHPFLTKLLYAFTDSKNIYFISEFMQGGELFFHLSKNTFKEKEVRFYMSEIFLAIQYLHNNNYIYRDLKPENILIGLDGHIKLTDFGLSKMLKNNQDKTYSLVGTIQYLAPEILFNKEEGYDKNCDWFSFGVVMFELYCGYHPFNFKNSYKIEKKIYEQKIKIPSFVGDDAKDLILKLTVINPKERLGAKNEDDIKNHPFFGGLNFDDVLNKKITPPFIPNVENEIDLRYFDKQFTKNKIDDSSMMNESNLNYSDQNIEMFEGFSYKPKDLNLETKN